MAAGVSASAAAIPAALLHSLVRSRLPASVVITGAVVSRTVSTCTKLTLVLPQPSLKFHVRVRTYALAQVASGVVTSLTRFSAGVAVQLSLAAGVSASAAAIAAAQTPALH